jgi:hypothetical protein
MEDREIVDTINRLAEQEHELERRAETDALGESEHAELKKIELQLDQCWDLLRQRRARRQAGQDPDAAEARPIDVVEHYQQ